MKAAFAVIIFLFSGLPCFSQRYILDCRFSESVVPPVPDYSKESSWASLPDKKDPADSLPGKTFFDNQSTATADVFFIHPTTYTYKPNTQYMWNGDVNDERLNNKTDNSPILYQASVFNGSCKIYAPRYRQAHISAFYSKNEADNQLALDTAYRDVKAAFEYYLHHYNNNRPIIIASHSQGTIHAYHLLKDFFQDDILKNRLIAAYLVGMPVNPDSLQFLPPCNSADQTGCYCTWNTVARNYYPKYYSDGLNHAICTNPLSWDCTNEYCEASLNEGAVLWKFGKVQMNACDAQVHEGMLWIGKPQIPLGFLWPVKIYHIGDYNLFYLNIRKNVQQRIDSYWRE